LQSSFIETAIGPEYLTAICRGEGAKHQIDVLAIDPLPMPFVFPTRILCEAKCFSQNGERSVGVPYVRNLFAEITDLQQTLPRQKRLSLEPAYDEPVSCVYVGALFSTIGFSRPAMEFANSYAISLVPLPSEIESKHIPTLMEKLKEFVKPSSESSASQGRIAGCPHECFRSLPFDMSLIQQVLKTAGRDILTLRTSAERRVFVYALDAILHNCPKLKEINSILSIHRVASIGNMMVLVRLTEPDFRRLAQALAKLFLERSNNGFANLAPNVPPEGAKRTTYGPVHPGEVVPLERTEHAPAGFERFGFRVLGVDLNVLALNGTRKNLTAAKNPCYFTLMLDFGLTLHARV
jgi:hypothetical protein